MEPRQSILRLAIASILIGPGGAVQAATPGWDCRTSADGKWDCRPGSGQAAEKPQAPAPVAPPRSVVKKPTVVPVPVQPVEPAPVQRRARPEQTPVEIVRPQPVRSKAVVAEPPQNPPEEAPQFVEQASSISDTAAASPAPSLFSAVPAGRASADFSRCPPNALFTNPSLPDRPMDGSIQVESDYVEGNVSTEATFLGDVVLTKNEKEIRGDTVTYYRQEERVDAEGAVYYQAPGLKFTASRAELRLDDDTGTLEQVDYQLPLSHARGQAEQADLLGSDVTTYQMVSYTTCNPGQEDWILRADDLEIDQASGRGVGRDVTIRFKDVPIFYTPYISFPIDDRRQSGFLTPSIAVSGDDGIDVTVPYYFNLAPNYDLTFSPRIIEQRGLLLGGETRYLNTQGEGKISAEFLPDDNKFGEERGRLDIQARHSFTERLRGEVKAGYVSDREYLEDFGDGFSSVSNLQLERRADLQWNGDFWTALGRFEYYQPADRNLLNANRSYSRLPQILVEGGLPDQFLGMDFDFRGEYTLFDRDGSVEGDRIDLKAGVSRPFTSLAGYITPSVAVRSIAYSLDNQINNLDDSPSATLPIVSVDSGLFFERDTIFGGRQLLQTLEPRLYYLYVEEEDQTAHPIFDTSRNDFNISQLFRDNRFSGGDLQGDANQITAAVTTRFLDDETGRELFQASLGEIFFFEDREVVLPGETRETDDNSNMIAEMVGVIGPAFNYQASYQYSPEKNQSERTAIQLRYREDNDHIFNFSYRRRINSLEQAVMSTRWPLAQNWSGVASVNYSIREDTLSDAFAGVEYESCCWLFRVVYREFVSGNNVDVTDQAVLFQFGLKGLTSVGDRVETLLEDGILGYSEE